MRQRHSRGRLGSLARRLGVLLAASLVIAGLVPASPRAFAQSASAAEPEHLAALFRPSQDLVAGSPHGRIAIERLAALLRKKADGSCVASRKLDGPDFEARARELLIAVLARLRSHHDAAVGEGALASFRQSAGGDVAARLARVRQDEAVARFLGLLASRDSADGIREALTHIARALEAQGIASAEQKAALLRPDDAVERAMESLDVAIDDFLDANRTPVMTTLRELQDAARAAIEGALDRSRLAAFDHASLGPAVAETLGRLCLTARR